MDKLQYLSVEHTEWQGEPAVRLIAGGYEALLIPGIGGNLIELRDNVRGLDLLRKPQDAEVFKARPQVYGIPVLFPPNRIEGGTFKALGKVYNFPINEPGGKKNHIHGFLRTRPWEVTGMRTIEDRKAEVEITFKADRSSDFFENYPHEFEISITYALSDDGLEQCICITNNSSSQMPMGLGFHTAFSIPFHPDSESADCLLKVSAGQMWEINENILPTGKLLPLDDIGRSLRNEGMEPQGRPVQIHYTALPLIIDGKEFNGAVIEDRSKELAVVYEVGNAFKHWIIWNETGDKGFICPEPQTWVINAPNVELPDELTGFRLLQPGEVWKDICRIYVKETGSLNI